MTIEELKRLAAALEIEVELQPQLIYVFYTTPDGLVNNFSISVKRARHENGRLMGDGDLSLLMQQYSDAREGSIVAVERPHGDLHRWLDRHDVIQALHTSESTLKRWIKEGLLHPSRMGRKCYFDAEEVDRLLRSNIIQENGRLDKTGFLM